VDEAKLKKIPLFADLGRKELKAVARFADDIDLEEGRQIVREGDWAYEFFALEQGTAEVRRGEQLLAELGPGDFFGEMGLVEDTRRNATVVATSPVVVVVMTARAFRQVSREHPEVAQQIRAAVEQRSRELSTAG
jgi:CRP-like cAMP-binding protein